MKKRLIKAAVLLFALFLCTGCAAKAEKNADLTQVMESMKQQMSNTQMMDLGREDLMPNYGVDPDDICQFAVCVDSTGTKGDEIILIRAVDDEAADRIRERLEERYRQKQTEMKDYMPEDYAVLKQCSVQQSGSYVALIVSPQYEELEKTYADALR